MTLDLRELSKRHRESYKLKKKNQKLHALVAGPKGSGKTTLSTTGPSPTYIFSFEPGGTDSIDPALIESGAVIVDNQYEDGDILNPTGYTAFMKNFNEMQKDGVFDQIGTVVVDSLTQLSTAMAWQLRKSDKIPLADMVTKSNNAKNAFQRQHWGILLDYSLLFATRLSNLPCHTIITGHLMKTQDEVTGAMDTRLALSGQASAKVPLIVSDLWLTERLKATKEHPTGEFIVRTAGHGSFHGTTRLRGLDPEEKPDIKAILKKAGLPWEDLPYG